MYSLATPALASANFDLRMAGRRGREQCTVPAPPDRARRWNDLEASWSFYSRDRRSVIGNQNGLPMAGLGNLETDQRLSGDGNRLSAIGILIADSRLLIPGMGIDNENDQVS